MKKRRALRAVVTVQAAHVSSSVMRNLYVRLLVMVPKGNRNVTVPTNCTTLVQEGSINPVWNQTFSIPVRRSSDVLVFNVLHRDATQSGPRLRRASLGSRQRTPSADVTPVHVPYSSVSRASPVEPSGMSSGAVSLASSNVATAPPEAGENGESLGVCLLPIESIPESGDIIHRRLELFEDGASGIGSLYIAAKLEEIEVDQWEKDDLPKAHVMKQFHRSRLSAFEDRFIGIGDLAAFLYEEGYSQDINANWDRAVTILSEQLAYRIFETTRSTADGPNFQAAKEQVERDQGLWDGI